MASFDGWRNTHSQRRACRSAGLGADVPNLVLGTADGWVFTGTRIRCRSPVITGLLASVDRHHERDYRARSSVTAATRSCHLDRHRWRANGGCGTPSPLWNVAVALCG